MFNLLIIKAMKSICKRFFSVAMMFLLVCAYAQAQEQTVMFPQKKQPGAACVSASNGVYTLSNDLFSASFKVVNDTLRFNGCEALDLLPGTEIFKVQLADGTEIPASQFALVGNVAMEDLTGDADAVKAARRFNGKQLVATFAHSNGLEVEWRAVLRDGSHYLRTELDIRNTGDAGINMYGITPMMYTVQNHDGQKAPAVVGNTRGAVIASDKLFAGLETPMGLNTAGEVGDLESFVFKAWDGEASWSWEPQINEIPEAITSMSQYGSGNVYGSRGYLVFRQKGEQVISFNYTGGNNKLQILGVDIVDVNGNIISHDYHYGSTGSSHSNRDYTINIPEVGAYMVRFFVSNKGAGEGFGSRGTISYSKKVTIPGFVHDLASTATPYVSPKVSEYVESGGDVITGDRVFTLESGMTYYIAANVKSGSTMTKYNLYIDENGALKASAALLQDSANYKWTLEANGNAWYLKNGTGKYLSYNPGAITAADEHYSFELRDDAVVSEFGAFSLYNPTSSGGKYMVIKVDGTSFNQNGTARNDGQWCSDYVFTKCVTTVGSIDASNTTMSDNWVEAWTGFNDWSGNLPGSTTNRGTKKYKDTGYYNMGLGRLDVLFDYTSGSHGLYVLGVQVIDVDGNVVAQEFKNGFTGSNSTVTYNVYVPEAGIYKLRYITDYIYNDGRVTNGEITVTYNAIEGITAQQGLTKQWTSSWTGFSVWNEAPADLKAYNNSTSSETTPASIQYIDYTYSIKSGKLSVSYAYTGGSHGLHPMGLVLYDLNGNVLSTDYHAGFAGGRTVNATYTVKVPETGFYKVRLVVDKNSGGTNTNGNITFSLTEIPSLGSIDDDEIISQTWAPATWKTISADEVPNRINELGCTDANTRVIEQQITIKSAGTLSVLFDYTSGNNKLLPIGIDIIDNVGNVALDDYHYGETGNSDVNNTYKMNVFAPGTYTIRFFANNAENINSNGNITISLKVDYTLHLIAPATTPITGLWRRQVTLASGTEWNVASVVGLIAPGQARRSFLAYSERERAVPWRAVPIYVSWYEVNINHNNYGPGEEYKNMTEEDCLPILAEWKTQLFDKYNEAPYAFVWDDGWDAYGEWKFHTGFPNGFTRMDSIGRLMGAGQGAWLGPVGGYGTSGGYRRSYWNSENRGGMKLSNPNYYNVFVTAVTNLLHNYGYDFRFFKFDGISSLFSATGPDMSISSGEEDAEAIIMAERVLRSIKEDVFLNTTVGTWASPFWFQFTDAVWRQEKDYGTTGNNSNDRENWITYRDRLVYQNFVQNSPLCPINTLMTHGFMLTGNADNSSDTNRGGWNASRNIDYKNVLNELRCAFACGSGMVELYNDYDLTNSINNGALWGDIAECMRWQRDNADVLPDIHWVGGNPWTGVNCEIYGWAAWNAKKAVLTLRNGANGSQNIRLTLREALDIPDYVKTTITFVHTFDDQTSVSGFNGLPVNTPIDIDAELTITLPGSSVFVFDGIDNSVEVETGKFYRLTDGDNSVTSDASGETLAMDANADVNSVFYLNGDSEFISFANGKFLNIDGSNCGLEVGSTGNCANFQKGATEGTVKVMVTDSTYLRSNTTSVVADATGSDWTLEEVKVLPVKVGSVGFTTLYTPVALAIPEGVEAYIAIRNDEYIDLTALEGTIPAETAVVIQAAAGTYNFVITNDVAPVENNVLIGGVETIAASEVENPFTLQTAAGEPLGVAMRKYTGTYINGFKMYMSVTDAVASALSFRFSGTTDIVEVENTAADTKAYDLFGRPVEEPVKGVYVVNGEKVIY